jgi:endonuclease/exonuclease/phosphatase family metal-dependent hydrolase
MGRPASPTTRDVSPGQHIESNGGYVPRRLALVALVVVLSLQSFRVLFPLAYNYGERTSFSTAGVLAGALFLAPFLAPAVRALLGRRVSLVLSLAGLGAARVTIQVWRPVPLWLSAIAAALALLALTLTWMKARSHGGIGGRRFVVGLLLGLAADAAILALFLTWEPAWQDGALPVGAAAMLAVAAIAAAWMQPPVRGPAVGPGWAGVWSTGALGTFLALHVLFLQNVGVTGAATELALPATTILILGADLLAVMAVTWTSGRRMPPAARLALGAGLVGLAALLNEVRGAPAVLVYAAAHPVAAVLLSEAFGREGRPGMWRAAAGMGLASSGFLALTLLFYLHYEIPLPFPNVALAPIAAALLAAAGLRAAGPSVPVRWTRAGAAVPAALPMVAVVVGALVGGVSLGMPSSGRAALRVVNYNVHTAVNVRGQLDPEAIARVIEAQRPDVVTLQEVSRGWAVSGSVDVAEWLSHRLGMRYVYAPAADYGFGNAILSRFRMTSTDWGYLPKGAGPMDRSWVRAVLDIGAGRRLTVIGAHLHHRHDTPDDDRTRLDQIGELLTVWGGERPTVIAGDMNAEPDTEEIARFRSAGLVAAGDLTVPTYPSTDPRDRIDYVFGTGDLVLSDATVRRSMASDHLAVAATVTLG